MRTVCTGRCWRSAALALTTLALASCRAAPPSAAEIAGCYQPVLGSWDRPPDQDRVVHLPNVIRLDTALADTRRGVVVHRARPDLDIHRPGSHPGYWQLQPEGDSLYVYWTSGYTGIGLELLPEADGGAAGSAIAFHDNVTGPDPRAPVRLRRITCRPEGDTAGQ